MLVGPSLLYERLTHVTASGALPGGSDSGITGNGADDRCERNTLMIIAHLVWGAGLGLATHFLSNEARGQLEFEV